MSYGKNGQIATVKITWEEFQTWQRWDEFPERKYDPPLTLDMVFWYKGKMYFLDRVNYEYVIQNEEGKIIATDKNFRQLLNKPIKEWHGDSFRKLIEDMVFEN